MKLASGMKTVTASEKKEKEQLRYYRARMESEKSGERKSRLDAVERDLNRALDRADKKLHQHLDSWSSQGPTVSAQEKRVRAWTQADKAAGLAWSIAADVLENLNIAKPERSA